MAKTLSDKQAVLDELDSVHQKRDERYDELIRLAEEQQSILLEGRHSDLAENIAGFDPLLLEIDQLDKRERTLVQRLDQADHRKEPAAPLKLEPSTVEKAARLHALTQTNRHLLANAMEFIDFTIHVVCRTAADAAAGANPAVVLDARV
jgi:hypothetical protein